MTVVVLLNAGARWFQGRSREREIGRIEELFTSTGLQADVRTAGAAELAARARAAREAGTSAVVAGGGDGTLGAVAAELAGGPTPLGVLPLGTLNHFARDLRLPLDLEGAVAVIAAGRARRVDVAEVNGRVFLNNSSIGLYPLSARLRRREERTGGSSRWRALGVACIDAVRRFPLMDVRIQADGVSLERRTPFVFVGNNRYDIELFAPEGRKELDGGRLNLCVASPATRLGVLRLGLRAACGSLRRDEEFEDLLARRVRVELDCAELSVAADGEVVAMRPPLDYRIRPRDLLVLAPPEERP